MQPIPLIVAIVLGLAALSFVLYPLYSRAATSLSAAFPAQREDPDASQVAANAPRLSERELHARQALQEVEFDFQLGNLDESEYRSLRTRYINRAALEMKQRQQREQELDEEIEKQLRTLKEAEKHEEA